MKLTLWQCYVSHDKIYVCYSANSSKMIDKTKLLNTKHDQEWLN